MTLAVEPHLAKGHALLLVCQLPSMVLVDVKIAVQQESQSCLANKD